MKKIYLLSAIIGFALSAFSQPDFKAENCLQINTATKLGFAVYVKPFEGFVPQTGNNYSWDFSAANWTNPGTPYLFQAAKSSIHTLFAESEINEYGSVLFPRDLFFTHSKNQDTLYHDGIYTSLNSVYRPRIPYLSFPMKYNDSTYIFTRQYANPNQPKTATGSVTRYWIYDGYGSLILPYGNVSNVYRIRTRQIDSVYVLKAGVVYDEIIWFRATDGIPVLRLQKNATIISAYYASADSPTAVNQLDNSGETSIFPNPFQNEIILKTTDSQSLRQFSLFDPGGRKVFSILNPENHVQLPDLKNGLYIYELKLAGNSVQRGKILRK